MITLRETLVFPETYPLERIGAREELLFFDIETTGFSAEYSSLYLIGCTFYEDQAWHLIQWFADSSDAERDVLIAFFTFLKRFSIVIHFNGDGFDIPFLTRRCRALGLTYDFSDVSSFDIYKKIRPYRNLLGLANMKQKAIEDFLHVKRTDMFSGGQLIEVYEEYLITHASDLFHLLILHNADDMKGMPSILPVLNYPDFLTGPFSLLHQEIEIRQDVFGAPCQLLILTCESPFLLPVPFSRSNSMITMEAEGRLLTFRIDLYQGELKYYYKDYKNYYYLIYEDKAIHKSVAEYVDREARIKASAQTCYCRQSGLFLPQFSAVWEPFLKQEYKSKITYVPYCGDMWQDEEHFSRYIRHLIEIL